MLVDQEMTATPPMSRTAVGRVVETRKALKANSAMPRQSVTVAAQWCGASSSPQRASSASVSSDGIARLRRLAQRGFDQLDRIVARPFGGTRERAQLTAVRIDQQCGRHAERLADALELL